MHRVWLRRVLTELHAGLKELCADHFQAKRVRPTDSACAPRVEPQHTPADIGRVELPTPVASPTQLELAEGKRSRIELEAQGEASLSKLGGPAA